MTSRKNIASSIRVFSALLVALSWAACSPFVSSATIATGEQEQVQADDVKALRELLQASGPTKSSGASAASKQNSTATAPAPGRPPPPPPPGPPQPEEVKAANITYVYTVAAFQRAFAEGAQDIEVRAHLDLRPLNVTANPGVKEAVSDNKYTHIVYSLTPTRSLRGNCQSTGANDTAFIQKLPELTEGRVEYPPLKPAQCVLLFDRSLLKGLEGTLWVDNLYLALARSDVRPKLRMLQYGEYQAAVNGAKTGQSMYITNTTLVGEGQGNARALAVESLRTSVLLQDVVMSSMTGDLAATVVVDESRAHFRNVHFRDIHTDEELFDVSYGSSVRLENCTFANVSVPHDEYVSTSTNDYDLAAGTRNFDIMYYPDDDSSPALDLHRQAAPADALYDTIINNDTMSDCLFRWVADGDMPPGCPPNAVQIREELDKQAQLRQGASVETADAPTELDAIPYDEYFDFPVAAPPAEAVTEREFLSQQDSWLARMREVMPELPVPEGFSAVFSPPAKDPPKEQRQRRAEAEKRAEEEREREVRKAQSEARGGAQRQGGDRMPQSAVIALCAVGAAAVLLCGALGALLISRRSSHSGGRFRKRELQKDKEGVQKNLLGSANNTSGTLPPVPEDGGIGKLPSKGAISVLPGEFMPKTSSQFEFEAAKYAVVSNESTIPHDLMNPAFEYVLPSCVTHGTSAAGTDQQVGSSGLPGIINASSLRARSHTEMTSSTLSDSTHHTGCTPQYIPSSSLEGSFASARFAASENAGSAAMSASQSSLNLAVPAALPGSCMPPASACLAPAPDFSIRTTDTFEMDSYIVRLTRQLDLFERNHAFLGRFRLLGRKQRRQGGQAVVQFAKGIVDTNAYAVKFFLDNESFYAEAALYTACFPHLRASLSEKAGDLGAILPPVGDDSGANGNLAGGGRFLPQVEALRDGSCGELVDPRGNALPPCIVMERGESLQDWSNRAEPDLFMTLAVLSNVAQRMADMHDAGYVHRDLKPANVMWLPRENRWTVIDFGCAARAGHDAPLSFTLAYAAPEVVVKYEGCQTRITADPAQDAWSLGVMAFELLTGAPAFRLLTDGRCRVMAQLKGDLPLPWEGELPADIARHLGAFKGPVLQMLHRDPAQRIPMRRFYKACTQLFASRTTVQA